MDPKRTRSETTTSPMATRMSVGTPYRAVAVLRRKNGRAVEAMGTRTKSRLSRRIRMRRHMRNRERRRRQRRIGAGSRTSRKRQRGFPPSPTVLTNTAAARGTCTGPSYRCDGSGRWMERRERNTPRNGHAIENGGCVFSRRRRRKRKGKLAQIVRK